jgi:copper chaperone CopZ
MKKLLLAALMPLMADAGTIQAEVRGMVCSLCVQGIKKAFSKEAGVESVELSLDDKKLVIKTVNDADITDDRLKDLLRDSGGYEAIKITRTK